MSYEYELLVLIDHNRKYLIFEGEIKEEMASIPHGNILK